MPGAGFAFLGRLSIEFATSSEWGGSTAPFNTRQLVRTTERSPMVTHPADCTLSMMSISWLRMVVRWPAIPDMSPIATFPEQSMLCRLVMIAPPPMTRLPTSGCNA
ncbi:hypothetical protein ASG82_08880 [Mycobacterium sp. Soil538]|nr:hypothetical protein ASG82_08880 [Mycobacterium sp. Soil538]